MVVKDIGSLFWEKMFNQLSKKQLIYFFTLYVSALGLLGYLVLTERKLLLPGIFLFAILSFLAEQLTVDLPMAGSISVGFPITYASLLLFGPLAAVLTDLAALLDWQDIKDRRPWYKIAFNASQFALSSGLAGLVYIHTGGVILTKAHRGLTGADFPAVFLPLFLSAITYLLLNTAFVSVHVGLAKKISPIDAWIRITGGTIGSYLALAAFGIVMAQIYVIAGPAGIILLVAPLLVARQVFQRYTKLRDVYSSSVMSLVKAVEVKDPYTRGHSERVAQYAEMIARELGLQEGRIEKLKFAGYLHDVGKIGIPKKILNKPGRLTEEEYQRVKGHSELGTSILREIEFLKDTMPAILYHHEHLDAKGYPEGLVKESIPLEARIMAVADSYDAMTSARAYRPPLAKETAMDELKRCSGTQFDSQVVEAFVKVLQEQKGKVLKDQAEELKVQEKVAENNSAVKKDDYSDVFRNEETS